MKLLLKITEPGKQWLEQVPVRHLIVPLQASRDDKTVNDIIINLMGYPNMTHLAHNYKSYGSRYETEKLII